MNDTPKSDSSTLTKEEIDARFTQALTGVVPAEASRVTIAQRLAPLRPKLLELRAKGYSMKQLNDALASELFNIKTTPATLGKIMAAKRHSKPKAKAIVAANGNPAAAPTPKPAVQS